MAERVIPQRELRNNVAAVLRAAEAGESFTVTVHGRPVARLVPPQPVDEPQVDVPWSVVETILALAPRDALLDELDELEAPIDLDR